MLSLQVHHITDLYCLVDDLVSHDCRQSGRPPALITSEVITILLWGMIAPTKQQTLKQLYNWIAMYHDEEFPKLPHYTTFVTSCHRALPTLISILQSLLKTTEPLRLVDATMLPVCTLKRSDSHKVAKNLANYGKNYQGWHYGFKLHASIDVRGRLCGVMFTPANIYDAQVLPNILNAYAKIACGDTLYGARVMRERIWKEYGTIIISPPHPTQKKKLVARWQSALLNYRSKIESVFDYLKNHLHLVSSFPRSIMGYFLHYLRVVTSYQLMALTLA
jgi:hypothetical protein